MAGILGAGYSLLTKLCSISLFWSFIGISPVVIIYFCAFMFIIRKSPDEEDEINQTPLINQDSSSDVGSKNEEDHVPLCDGSIFKMSWGFFLNCGLVYFFEYCITSVFSHCSADESTSKKYPYLYPLLNLIYQIGVFISRSSIIWFKFPWVTFLTCFQGGFFVLWLFNSFKKFLAFWIMIPLMLCVGLLGGCSYVNVFNLIMESTILTVKEKELTTNWNAFFISVFIILASVFTFISEYTFLKNYINSN